MYANTIPAQLFHYYIVLWETRYELQIIPCITDHYRPIHFKYIRIISYAICVLYRYLYGVISFKAIHKIKNMINLRICF